mgnify:CR=1 FL=1
MKGKKRKAELAFIRALRNIIYKQYEIVIIGDREFAGKEFVKNICNYSAVEINYTRQNRESNIKTSSERMIKADAAKNTTSDARRYS